MKQKLRHLHVPEFFRQNCRAFLHNFQNLTDFMQKANTTLLILANVMICQRYRPYCLQLLKFIFKAFSVKTTQTSRITHCIVHKIPPTVPIIFSELL